LVGEWPTGAAAAYVSHSGIVPGFEDTPHRVVLQPGPAGSPNLMATLSYPLARASASYL